jgi:hypothetical protein
VNRFARSFIINSIIVTLLASGIAISLKAQTGSLRLEGIVWDPSGNIISGAQLTAVEESTEQASATVSDNDGYYRFLVLQPGVYTVTAKAKGFKDVVHRHIFLYTLETASENFTFEVSAIDKEIGPGERPQLLDSDIAGSYSRSEIEAVPLVNRDPLALLVLQPGVQIAGGNESKSTVNGARRGMNAIRMDGLSITDTASPVITSSLLPVNPSFITGFRITTTGSNAELGGSGGAQVATVSRAGTKKWSGTIYDFFRNKNMNARDYFNTSFGLSPPRLTRNIFGGSVSGPIKGKSLLFADFEGNRTDQEFVRNRTVLTPIAKTGVFQWFMPDDATRDSTTVRTFNIAASDPLNLGINPAVAAILAKLPDPNNFAIGDGLNTGGFRFKNPTYFQREHADARFDRDLNDIHRIFARFNLDRTDATDVANNADAPFPDAPSGTFVNNSWGVAVGSNYTLSPDKINELRVGYLRSATDLKRPARTAGPMLLANSWTNPLDPSFPGSSNSSLFEITDNFSHALRLHTLKYGINFRRTQLGSVDNSGIYPNITLGTNNGNAPSSAIGPSLQSEISETDRQSFEKLYNDLLGRIESVSRTFNSNPAAVLPAGTGSKRSYASQEYDGFIQDTWRIKPTFTLNLGLRFEMSTAPKEADGIQGVLDQAAQISTTAHISNFKLIPGSKGYSSLKDFAPRAGFSWDIFGSGTMVLRGAYGIYYDRPIGGLTRFIDKNGYGFSQTVTTNPNKTGTDVRFSSALALPALPGVQASQPPDTRSSSVAVWDPNLRTPRIYQFNLTLQKRFAGALLEASYVGTRGKKLFQYLNLNQTKTDGDFLNSFNQLKALRDLGTPVPAGNTLVRIFGSPVAAFNALGGSNFDSGQVGIAADTLDRDYFGKYAAAGVSDFYIRNFPQFNVFLFGTNAAESSYDSLQIGIRKSTSHYHLRAFYTWSKALDSTSSDGLDYTSPSNSFNPTRDRALSDFDRTHVMNVAWDYAIPAWRDLEGDYDAPAWIRAFIGGWNLGTLWTWESGAHFSVNSGLQNQYAGVSSLANFSGNRNQGHTFNLQGTIYWFYAEQASAFTYPLAGQTPTSRRNDFTGPRYFNVDALLHKQFRIAEGKALELRMEGLNVFNQVRFGVPNTNLYDPAFGTFTTTQGTQRVLQAGLRFQF